MSNTLPSVTITSAKVLLNKHGMDVVVLYTESPCPMVPEFLPSQPPLALMFHASQGHGANYVRTNFNIEPNIVEV